MEEINGRELIRLVSNESDIRQKNVRAVLEGLNSVLCKELKKGNSVKIAGLGKFERKENKPRNIKDINSKEQMTIKPKDSVRFAPLPSFRNEVNSNV